MHISLIRKRVRQIGTVVLDRRWWSFFLQRRFMNPSMRNRLAGYVVRLRPAVQSTQRAPVKSEHAEALKSTGIAMLGPVLSSTKCQELLLYFQQKVVQDPYRDTAPFLPDSVERHPDCHVAHHSPLDILRAPHLLALANEPRILALVENFLGCKPTIGYLAAWWSYCTRVGAQQAEFFHRDVDDWKFVKLFVYLTDVGPESGPHVYVQESSRSAKLAQIRRFTDEEVRNAFGQGNVMRITASAGQAFLADTFGIHKGEPVIRGTRLVFQAVYGISPMPYGPRSPLLSRSDLAISGLDPWVNRAYLDQ